LVRCTDPRVAAALRFTGAKVFALVVQVIKVILDQNRSHHAGEDTQVIDS
jgi:hypothetical protein